MTKTQPLQPISSGQFEATKWTLVTTAARRKGADEQPREVAEAMESLCRAYWPPLYAFIRRNGFSAHDAEELTQEFFANLLEKNFLGDVHPDKGRFRSFLLASAKHFLSNHRDHIGALKRGGGRKVISLDSKDFETLGRIEPSHGESPEKSFDRKWAMILLQAVLDRLGAECRADGVERLFNALRGYLTHTEESRPYAQAALELGMSEGSIKVAVHRMRKRYRALLREEIAQTVERDADVDDEIRDLFSAFGN